jgi:uncharacterized protein (TIGR02145 family)
MRTQLNKIILAAGIMLAITFTFSCSKGDDEDGDGGSCDIKDYGTVTIGDQTWMAKNFNCNVSGSKCYDNDNANCKKYGRLYDWETAKKACPSGWHLPTNADWDALYRYADGDEGTSNPYGSNTAGRYLKATSSWNSGGNGEDTYGFSAMPGGNGDSGGNFWNAGEDGYWWSSSASENNSNDAYNRGMFYYNELAYYYVNDKSSLYSVRCVED